MKIKGWYICVDLDDGTRLYETKDAGSYSIYREDAYLHRYKPNYCSYEYLVKVVTK